VRSKLYAYFYCLHVFFKSNKLALFLHLMFRLETFWNFIIRSGFWCWNTYLLFQVQQVSYKFPTKIQLSVHKYISWSPFAPSVRLYVIAVQWYSNTCKIYNHSILMYTLLLSRSSSPYFSIRILNTSSSCSCCCRQSLSHLMLLSDFFNHFLLSFALSCNNLSLFFYIVARFVIIP